jgi:hypothetical protein
MVAAAAVVLMPALAEAQTNTPPIRTESRPSDPAQSQPTEFSRLWIAGGGGSASFLVDCSECGDPEDYHHTGGVLVNAGRAITRRLDVGMELVWVPGATAGGEKARTTFVLAATQFRPWPSQGFFVKGGMGLAFIRNSVTIPEQAAAEFVTKAFSVGLGTGWEWRLRSRVGAQIYASQHVAAAGDIVTNGGTAENVMVNYWSIGGAVVIR